MKRFTYNRMKNSGSTKMLTNSKFKPFVGKLPKRNVSLHFKYRKTNHSRIISRNSIRNSVKVRILRAHHIFNVPTLEGYLHDAIVTAIFITANGFSLLDFPIETVYKTIMTF